MAQTTTTEFSLDNGLKVIVREDHRAPVVVSQLWYKVGSSYEKPGSTGLAHALEHMMFKGSSKLGPGESSRQERGDRGADTAGKVWRDAGAGACDRGVHVPEGRARLIKSNPIER